MRGAVPLLLLALAACTADKSHFEPLYQAHRWFELRDAVEARRAPPFYRGAVAAVFNDIAIAETELRRAGLEQVYEAHRLLASSYLRAGRYRQARAEVEAMLKTGPATVELKTRSALLAALGDTPDQSVAARGPSIIPCRSNGGNLLVPVTLNGKEAEYIFDTGANYCGISESEAKRLGLTERNMGDARVGTLDGGQVAPGAAAVAHELRIGTFRLHNVAFFVVPDRMFPGMEPRQRGAIGLPVLLALRTLRWNRAGMLEFGFPAREKNLLSANIAFEGLTPAVQATFRQTRVAFALDTGAVNSLLFRKFRDDFATLTEVPLQLGGFAATLHDARLAPDYDGFPCCHGNLGLDALTQANRMTIDFASMRLILE